MTTDTATVAALSLFLGLGATTREALAALDRVRGDSLPQTPEGLLAHALGALAAVREDDTATPEPEQLVADPHTADLVLARTAITPGRRYWTCARFGHSIDPRDFVHVDGPCVDAVQGSGPTAELDGQARP